VTPFQDGGTVAVGCAAAAALCLGLAIFTAFMAEAEWRGSDAGPSLAAGVATQVLYVRAIFLAVVAVAFGTLGLLFYRMRHFRLAVAEDTP